MRVPASAPALAALVNTCILTVWSRPAEARGAPRQLLQATPVCSWLPRQRSKCTLNPSAVEQLGAFSELAQRETAFYDCFDRTDPLAPCLGDNAGVPTGASTQQIAPTAAPATGPAAAAASAPEQAAAAQAQTRTKLVPPLGMGKQPTSNYGAPAACPYNGVVNPLTTTTITDGLTVGDSIESGGFTPATRPLPQNTVCGGVFGAPAYAAAGQVLVKQPNGACKACGEAVCTLWQADNTGVYTKECSGRCVRSQP